MAPGCGQLRKPNLQTEREWRDRTSIPSYKRKIAGSQSNTRGKHYSLVGNYQRGEYGIQAEVRYDYGAIIPSSPHFSHVFQPPTTLHYQLNLTQQELHTYKQNFQQRMKDLDTLRAVLKYLATEKEQLFNEKNQLADNLQKTEEMIECYKHKSNQLVELQTQHDKLKHEFECVIGEKNQLSEEKAKIAKELKNAEEKITQKSEQLDEVQPQLDELKGELKRVKSEASTELMTLTQVLKHKENTFTRFVEEINSMKVDPKVYCLDDCFHCLICMEPLTQSEYGEHNICSLACGHFFGRVCITKWIRTHEFYHSAKCPICQKTATLGDIRKH